MKYRRLGRTDLRVSAISVGFWAVADPNIWGAQDEKDAIAAVHTALDLGINFFDTAEGYGNGYSEQLLGRALAGRRDQAIIASKVSQRNLAPDDLVAACERSLRHLGTNTIDLYQIHWPSRTVPLEDSMAALERLRDQGKIRFIGVSNFGKHDFAELQQAGRAESNQVPYSLLFRAIEYDIMPACQQAEVSILPYSPLLHGLLTGKFASIEDVPPERARGRHFASTRPRARHNEPGAETETFQAIDTIRAISAKAGLPMAEVALAWVIAQPNVASVIAGARSAKQVRMNAQAAAHALAPGTLATLTQATDDIKAILGRNPDMWLDEENSRYR